MKMTLKLSYEEGTAVLDALRKVAHDAGWSDDEIESSDVMDVYASVLDAALDALGIEVLISNAPTPDEDEVDDFGVPVDYESDFDEDEDEDEDEGEEDETDTTTYSLTAKGEFALRYMEAGHTFEEACKIADLLFPSNSQPQPDAIERMIVERNGKRCLTETNATVLLRIIGDTVQERMEDDTQYARAEMIKKIFVKVAEIYRIEEIIAGE